MKKFFTTLACFSAATAVRTTSLSNAHSESECQEVIDELRAEQESKQDTRPLKDLFSLRHEIYDLFEVFDEGENVEDFLLWALNLNLSGGPVTKILRWPNDEVLQAFSGNIDTIEQFNDALEAIFDQRKAQGMETPIRFELPSLPDFRTCNEQQVLAVYELYIPTYKRRRAEHRLNTEKPLLEEIKEWIMKKTTSESSEGTIKPFPIPFSGNGKDDNNQPNVFKPFPPSTNGDKETESTNGNVIKPLPPSQNGNGEETESTGENVTKPFPPPGTGKTEDNTQHNSVTKPFPPPDTGKTENSGSQSGQTKPFPRPDNGGKDGKTDVGGSSQTKPIILPFPGN